MCFCGPLPALFSKSHQAMAPESKLVTSSRINQQCIQAFDTKSDSLPNPAYLPLDAFDQLLSEDLVKATIGNSFRHSSTREKSHLFEYARRNRKIFLTLASAKLLKKIKVLRKAQVKDCHLPVREEYDRTTGRCRIFSSENQPLNGFVEGDDEENEDEWDLAHIRQFIANQWLFYAVAFDKSRFLYKGLPEKRPLPFVEISVGAAGGGKFGKIFRVGLRREHLTPDHSKFQYLRLVCKSKLRTARLQY